jgi:predicted enzyme related to lactoylglutathione lyase
MNYKLGITIIYVRDIKKVSKFYTEVLGLPVVKEQSSDTFVALATTGGTLIALEDVSRAKPYEKPAPAGIELGLEVEDVDATWRDWQAKGVKTLSEPEDFPFGRAFDAQDPEGHLLSIYKLRAG